MARSIHEIEQEVRSLRAADRNQLLRDLIADIDDGGSEHDIEDAWLQEAQRRYKELREGVVEPVPADVVIRRAKSRLNSED